MDRSNSMLGRSKAMENNHIYKFFEGFQQQSGIIENSEKMEEFNEEDIWGSSIDSETKHVVFQENSCNAVAQFKSMGKERNSNDGRRSVKIPESCHEVNNNKRRTRFQPSAPLTIPDCRSQIVWEEKNSENYRSRSHGIVDDEDNDGRDFERIPPHELIARQLAQSGIASFSVYEGVGRTLKGRDLSRVRNAVWMRTGFIG